MTYLIDVLSTLNVFVILSCLVGYLIGSIPSGYWFAWYGFGIDVTTQGSGNIGATNVGRVLGSSKYFLLIFLFDALKAAAYLHFIIAYTDNTWPFLVAGMLLIGNAHSLFLRFKGGKGVATALGVVAALYPLPVTLLFMGMWVGIYLSTRRAALASISAVSLLPFTATLFGSVSNSSYIFLCMLIGWITFRHRTNIMILLKEKPHEV